jgi:hypothetical protein
MKLTGSKLKTSSQNEALDPSAKKKIGRRPIFFKQIGIFCKRVFLMKNSLSDKPELCFYAKKQQGGKILKK